MTQQRLAHAGMILAFAVALVAMLTYRGGLLLGLALLGSAALTWWGIRWIRG